MARPNKPEESWQTDAVQLMVRNSISLRQAASELQVPITTLDAENIQRRRSFQKLLRDARNSYNTEIGADPGLTKASVIGSLNLLAQKLAADDELDKAAEVFFKLAKLAGWVGADSSVNVFGGLTSKDYAEVRKRLETAPQPKSENVN